MPYSIRFKKTAEMRTTDECIRSSSWTQSLCATHTTLLIYPYGGTQHWIKFYTFVFPLFEYCDNLFYNSENPNLGKSEIPIFTGRCAHHSQDYRITLYSVADQLTASAVYIHHTGAVWIPDRGLILRMNKTSGFTPSTIQYTAFWKNVSR